MLKLFLLLLKTLYNHHLSDIIDTTGAINRQQADQLLNFFRDHPLFRWSDANNDCEDRANAICILLDDWGIQNGKGWAFSGYMFNKIGYLHNNWKYHVAALLPVNEEGTIKYYIIDPATADQLINVADWAANITDYPHSYYLIKEGDYYIFPHGKIERDNWHKRNKRNYNWTIQGLSGINGISSKGRAQLSFNKSRVLKTAVAFNRLKSMKPDLV